MSTSEELHWSPLSSGPRQITSAGLGDQEVLSVGAFGTCGDPRDPEYRSWRHDLLYPTLEQYGVADYVYNPEVEEWHSGLAVVEGIMLARASVLTVPVTNQAAGASGVMEAGLAVLGGFKRGQDVSTYIELNDDSPEQTYVARVLARNALSTMAGQYPVFEFTDSLALIPHIAGVAMRSRLAQAQSSVGVHTEYSLEAPADLHSAIYLSGTSGNNKPQWIGEVQHRLEQYGVPSEDSYRSSWWSTAHVEEELQHKAHDAVQLTAITNETKSLGALAELGPRMLMAELSGQSFGVYIEPPSKDLGKDAVRTRLLALEHLGRLRQDFPDMPIFVAEDLGQLAVFGMSEYFRQRQRQRARGQTL